MNPADPLITLGTFLGQEKGGVEVSASPTPLMDGQGMRVEPLAPSPTNLSPEDRIRQLEHLFQQWTEEDRRISEEEADRLSLALADREGLRFRSHAVE